MYIHVIDLFFQKSSKIIKLKIVKVGQYIIYTVYTFFDLLDVFYVKKVDVHVSSISELATKQIQ
jgi:hypothetical protein